MGRALLSLLVIASTACVRGGAFQCATNNECVLSAVPGICESVGYCSFPDVGCESGFRFGAQSGPYAGQCVPRDDTPGVVSIGGDVSGLAGSGLILRDNGIDDLAISSAGPFRFETQIATGDAYEVTVGTQPTNPTQTCAVANGSGVAAGVDITDIAVTCATTTFVIGGTVTGLVGSGLVLTNNGGDDKPITADGAFMFATKIASSAPYSVAIKTQPAGQTCDVSGATGIVGASNVSTVVVNCDPTRYTVGGTVTGLEGTAVLRNNGTDLATLTANGTFAFPTTLAATNNYTVTVMMQPAYPPRSQTCVVMMGTGQVTNANITSVTVTCTTNTFTVGGTVTGLVGSLGLQNNGGDPLVITSSGAYGFPTPIASGNAFNVTISAQPSGQTCTFTTSPTGTITNSNITNVLISCGTGGDPGILCGTTYCNPASELCCITSGVPACSSTCNGANTTPLNCDTQQDCVAAGSPQTVCCGSVNGSVVNSVYCGNPTLCTAPKAYYCDPNITNPCPHGGTCMPTSSPFPGWYRCF